MFDIHQDPFDGGELNERVMAEYMAGLVGDFAAAPEGRQLEANDGDFGWVQLFIEYGFTCVGESPAEMTVGGAREILFDIIPRKVSTQAEAAPEIVTSLRAFWQFLDRAYRLPNAPRILGLLNGGAERELRCKLSDPSNFGMAKSFLMAGEKAGFDMSTEEGLHAFTALYNASMHAGPQSAPHDELVSDYDPPHQKPPQPLGPLRSVAELRARDRERKKLLKKRLSHR